MFKLSDDLGLTIPKNMISYLKRETTDEYVDPYLFEFYVYQKMYHQLDRGMILQPFNGQKEDKHLLLPAIVFQTS